MSNKWSSIAHEKSNNGHILNLFPILGCFLSEILNITLSLNAGFLCFMSVLILKDVLPSLALNIFSQSLKLVEIDLTLQLHSNPFCLFPLKISEEHSQT